MNLLSTNRLGSKSVFAALTILLTSILSSRQIEVYVCLCDNDHQGIAPVGKAIGNGLDPDRNLYWGCSDGLKAYFKKSSKWQLKRQEKLADPILVTLHFTHRKSGISLVAHAYRGDRMERCLQDFLQKTRTAGKGDLIAFIGHNGLMDTKPTIPEAAAPSDEPSDSIVLGCLTESYFTAPLAKMNSRPLLLTKSLMYPGSFILHDAIEIWLKNGSLQEIRNTAAKAYAKNQKIPVRSALTVFSKIRNSPASLRKE